MRFSPTQYATLYIALVPKIHMTSLISKPKHLMSLRCGLPECQTQTKKFLKEAFLMQCIIPGK